MTAIAVDERLGIRLPPEAGAATIRAGQTVVGLAGLRVRQLGASDLPSVERHLVQLEPSDRRARFLYYRPDAAIAAYARGIDPSCTVLVGAFDPSDRMVGLAEAHPTDTPRTVEVAVSIDPAFRRRGLGQRLVARALALAFDRGMQSAEFVFAPNNRALAGLVDALGGRITAPGHALIDRSQIVWNARQPEARRLGGRRIPDSFGCDLATVFSVAAIPAFVAGAAMLAKAWLYASAPIIARPARPDRRSTRETAQQ